MAPHHSPEKVLSASAISVLMCVLACGVKRFDCLVDEKKCAINAVHPPTNKNEKESKINNKHPWSNQYTEGFLPLQNNVGKLYITLRPHSQFPDLKPQKARCHSSQPSTWNNTNSFKLWSTVGAKILCKLKSVKTQSVIVVWPNFACNCCTTSQGTQSYLIFLRKFIIFANKRH